MSGWLDRVSAFPPCLLLVPPEWRPQEGSVEWTSSPAAHLLDKLRVHALDNESDSSHTRVSTTLFLAPKSPVSWERGSPSPRQTQTQNQGSPSSRTFKLPPCPDPCPVPMSCSCREPGWACWGSNCIPAGGQGTTPPWSGFSQQASWLNAKQHLRKLLTCASVTQQPWSYAHLCTATSP